MKQNEAVYQAVVNVMGEREDSTYQPSKEERDLIVSIVAEGLHTGKVGLSEAARATYGSFDEIEKYAKGLVSNHLRKDTRLNGGEKYEPKNPGSRAGSSDPEIKELRKLIRSGFLSDRKQIEVAEARISERLAAIKAEKAPAAQAEIDFSVLSPELLSALGIEEEATASTAPAAAAATE